MPDTILSAKSWFS